MPSGNELRGGVNRVGSKPQGVHARAMNAMKTMALAMQGALPGLWDLLRPDRSGNPTNMVWKGKYRDLENLFPRGCSLCTPSVVSYGLYPS